MIDRATASRSETSASTGSPASKKETLEAGNIAMALETRAVTLAGELVSLTHQEFELLHVLMQAPNCVLANTRICETIWGSGGRKETRRLAVVVSHLRRKLEPAGTYEIENVRCRGYGLMHKYEQPRGLSQ